ncbi:hypothetical protein BU16DRAFT_568418 [Lophium mytilinum]|uniref:Uncharacterized protein n=1 Tax=Lophium mytilinum TaxID=390894 RepID=A0A6A6Q847_9PEZI|nr:hypothetical protein BU16DRAFT_568418 [Lophium mytilinum]
MAANNPPPPPPNHMVVVHQRPARHRNGTDFAGNTIPGVANYDIAHLGDPWANPTKLGHTPSNLAWWLAMCPTCGRNNSVCSKDNRGNCTAVCFWYLFRRANGNCRGIHPGSPCPGVPGVAEPIWDEIQQNRRNRNARARERSPSRDDRRNGHRNRDDHYYDHRNRDDHYYDHRNRDDRYYNHHDDRYDDRRYYNPPAYHPHGYAYPPTPYPVVYGHPGYPPMGNPAPPAAYGHPGPAPYHEAYRSRIDGRGPSRPPGRAPPRPQYAPNHRFALTPPVSAPIANAPAPAVNNGVLFGPVAQNQLGQNLPGQHNQVQNPQNAPPIGGQLVRIGQPDLAVGTGNPCVDPHNAIRDRMFATALANVEDDQPFMAFWQTLPENFKNTNEVKEIVITDSVRSDTLLGLILKLEDLLATFRLQILSTLDPALIQQWEQLPEFAKVPARELLLNTTWAYAQWREHLWRHVDECMGRDPAEEAAQRELNETRGHADDEDRPNPEQP